ncbi:unnamed protein product [Malus baccata var. baccata]
MSEITGNNLIKVPGGITRIPCRIGAYTKKDYKKSPNALENPLLQCLLMDKAQRTQPLLYSFFSIVS